MQEPTGATANASNGSSKGAVPQRARSLDMNNPEADEAGSSSSSSVTSTRAATSAASIPAIAEPPPLLLPLPLPLQPAIAELSGSSSQLVHACHSLPHGGGNSRSSSRTHSPVHNRSVSTITAPTAAVLHQQHSTASEVLSQTGTALSLSIAVGPGAGYSGPYPVLESGQTVRYRRSRIEWWNADLQTLPPVTLFVSGFARGLSQREYELLLLERLGPGTSCFLRSIAYFRHIP